MHMIHDFYLFFIMEENFSLRSFVMRVGSRDFSNHLLLKLWFSIFPWYSYQSHSALHYFFSCYLIYSTVVYRVLSHSPNHRSFTYFIIHSTDVSDCILFVSIKQKAVLKQRTVWRGMVYKYIFIMIGSYTCV